MGRWWDYRLPPAAGMFARSRHICLLFQLVVVEAPPGFEPGNEGFAVPCLTNLATVPCRGRSEYREASGRSRSERQGKKEAAPLPLCPLPPDAAAVGLDDAPGDGEAQAGAVRGG